MNNTKNTIIKKPVKPILEKFVSKQPSSEIIIFACDCFPDHSGCKGTNSGCGDATLNLEKIIEYLKEYDFADITVVGITKGIYYRSPSITLKFSGDGSCKLAEYELEKAIFQANAQKKYVKEMEEFGKKMKEYLKYKETQLQNQLNKVKLKGSKASP